MEVAASTLTRAFAVARITRVDSGHRRPFPTSSGGLTQALWVENGVALHWADHVWIDPHSWRESGSGRRGGLLPAARLRDWPAGKGKIRLTKERKYASIRATFGDQKQRRDGQVLWGSKRIALGRAETTGCGPRACRVDPRGPLLDTGERARYNELQFRIW